MNYKNKYQHTVNHYAQLALSPGWIDEARHSVKKLEKEHPETYTGLGLAVADQIKLLKEQEKGGKLNEHGKNSSSV
jgi:hypothetical protein